MSNRSVVHFVCICWLIAVSLIHSSIANHLTKNSSAVVSKASERTSISQILEDDNLESALKNFLDEWDRIHRSRDHSLSNTNDSVITNQLIAGNTDSEFNETFGWQSDSAQVSVSSTSALTAAVASIRHKRRYGTDNLEELFERRVDEEDEASEGNCTRCVRHEEAKSRRLENIKVNILNKLGLKAAPNITGKPLPRIPPLHHLLDRYNMLGDDPRVTGPQLLSDFMEDQDSTQTRDNEDFEDFFVSAERSISFAQQRMY